MHLMGRFFEKQDPFQFGGLRPPLFLGRDESPPGNQGSKKGKSVSTFSKGRKAGVLVFLFIFRTLSDFSPREQGLQSNLNKTDYKSQNGAPCMKKIYSKILLITLIVSTIIFSAIHVTFGVH
jgi:hypothetical protein